MDTLGTNGMMSISLRIRSRDTPFDAKRSLRRVTNSAGWAAAQAGGIGASPPMD
jgi:hypothetical protein